MDSQPTCIPKQRSLSSTHAVCPPKYRTGVNVCHGYSSYSLYLSSNRCHRGTLYCLPDDKILDSTKFKTFADNQIIGARVKISVFGRVENIVEKGDKC